MSAPAWDCYSPVALVLWRAADFAEAGDLLPVNAAAEELRAGQGLLFAALDLVGAHQGRRSSWLAHVLCIRQLAEFGPAGRPR